jgi:hypothetical protein
MSLKFLLNLIILFYLLLNHYKSQHYYKQKEYRHYSILQIFKQASENYFTSVVEVAFGGFLYSSSLAASNEMCIPFPALFGFTNDLGNEYKFLS